MISNTGSLTGLSGKFSSISILIIGKLIIRAAARAAAGCVVNLNRHDPLRICIRKRIEQYVLNCAEDRSRRADAESQRYDGHEREGRLVAESAESIAEILQY